MTHLFMAMTDLVTARKGEWAQLVWTHSWAKALVLLRLSGSPPVSAMTVVVELDARRRLGHGGWPQQWLLWCVLMLDEPPLERMSVTGTARLCTCDGDIGECHRPSRGVRRLGLLRPGCLILLDLSDQDPLRWQGCVVGLGLDSLLRHGEATMLSISLRLGRGERSGPWKGESPRDLTIHGSGTRPPHSDECDGCSRWNLRSELMSPDLDSWTPDLGGHRLSVMSCRDRLHPSVHSTALLDDHWQCWCDAQVQSFSPQRGRWARAIHHHSIRPALAQV